MELRGTLATAPDGPGPCALCGLGSSIPALEALVGTRSPVLQDVPRPFGDRKGTLTLDSVLLLEVGRCGAADIW